MRHTAASPVGMKVTVTAELTAVEGRILSFKVYAEDTAGAIGEGSHTRTIERISEPYIVWGTVFVQTKRHSLP